MRRIVASFVFGLALCLAGRAEADIITFDELIPRDTVVLGTIVCADPTGFRFLSDHFHMLGSPLLPGFTDNGTRHIGYESGRGFPITMERVGGGTFSLRALDVAEFYSPPQPDRPNAELLRITGQQLGGGTVTFTVNLDGVSDGPGGVPDFEHVVVPATFVNLTSVVFTGLRAGGASGGVSIDNIDYTAGAPEVLAPCVATPLPVDPPAVAITAPLPGPVAYSVLVEASASSYVGIASVRFEVDGQSLGSPDTSEPYSRFWDTTAASDGIHTLTAIARDVSGTEAMTSIDVTVEHPVPMPHFLTFDGVDDYLETADAADLSFGTGTADRPFTAEMWLRPTVMGRHQLLGKWGETANQEYRIRVVSGYLVLELRDQSAGASAGATTLDNFASLAGGWHHVAATYDGRGGATAANGITIYVDGVAVPVWRN
ncbi:MAG: hypothetical protein KA371_06235, partial [Acidobacteria bacterium]|nr:hypothetical protein [Acidobacteriota bacterium]